MSKKQKNATRRNDQGETDIRRQVVQELITSYWMEMETIQNHVANSVNLDGIRAEEVKKLCDGVDHGTQDLCITLHSDDEEHRHEFIGFLAEYDKKAAQEYTL